MSVIEFFMNQEKLLFSVENFIQKIAGRSTNNCVNSLGLISANPSV